MEIVITLLASSLSATIVSWVLRRLDKRLDKKQEKDDRVSALQRAIQAMMYDRIKHIAKVYIAQGSCTLEEYEDLKRLHDSYHNDTGGNGFLDEVMKTVSNLPKRAA